MQQRKATSAYPDKVSIIEQYKVRVHNPEARPLVCSTASHNTGAQNAYCRPKFIHHQAAIQQKTSLTRFMCFHAQVNHSHSHALLPPICWTWLSVGKGYSGQPRQMARQKKRPHTERYLPRLSHVLTVLQLQLFQAQRLFAHICFATKPDWSSQRRDTFSFEVTLGFLVRLHSRTSNGSQGQCILYGNSGCGWCSFEQASRCWWTAEQTFMYAAMPALGMFSGSLWGSVVHLS